MKTYTKQTLQLFWQFSKPYALHMGFITFGLGIVIAADIAQPLVYRGLVNVVAGGNIAQTGDAYRFVVYAFFLALLYNIGWRAVIAMVNIFQGQVKRDLYRHCYEYVINHTTQFFGDNFVGSLVAKMNRYDRSFEKICDEIIFGAGRTIVLLLATLIVLVYHIPLAAVMMAIWAVLYILITYYANKYKMRFDLVASAQDSKVTGQVADSLTNALTIKLFVSELTEKKHFDALTEDQYRKRRQSWDWSNYIDMLQGGLMLVLEVAIMLTAVWLWQQQRITVGDFVLLQSYLLSMFQHLWSFGRNIRGLYQSVADANEMTEILVAPYHVVDAPQAKDLKVQTGAIAFSNVSFGYIDKSKVFNKFNLNIAGGERVAFVGPSGGGKSTVVKLLYRFYDIQKGSIAIDGQDIAQVTQQSLRKYISLVPQDPILFHRSLFENIRYAKPRATEKEVIAAAKAAHCHEFISKLPDKYKTLVGERGVKLSGGERQRVAIARALLKNAPILILDEATSSLDSESETLIQDALQTLMRGKTTIVIAHRLSTIMAMDRIVVIENGRITEQGKHDELLKANTGKYQKLWHIQAGGFAQ